jgi:hypothetical protein
MLIFKTLFTSLSKPDRKIALTNILFALMLIGVVGWFGWKQFRVNPGWSSMIEDSKVALQIDKYPNWQNPHTLGYPQSLLGKAVAGNTYEPLSWATAGLTIFIPENPLGIGILSKPFGVLLNAKYPNSATTLFPHIALGSN